MKHTANTTSSNNNSYPSCSSGCNIGTGISHHRYGSYRCHEYIRFDKLDVPGLDGQQPGTFNPDLASINPEVTISVATVQAALPELRTESVRKQLGNNLIFQCP